MSGRIGADLSLDVIDNWFRVGKPIGSVKTVPRSKSAGRGLGYDAESLIPEEPFVPPYKRHPRKNNPNQTAYAAHYQQLESQSLTQTCQPVDLTGGGDGVPSRMEEIESDSIATGTTTVTLPGDMTEEEANQVYKHYYEPHRPHKYDPRLPITACHEEVVATIESNQVTVIQGATGSGKTTQVPQYILDHYAKENRYCNIIVTQPRRIAAISIAMRVCHERNWQCGRICGYQVAMDKEVSEDTRLSYVTTGILLQKLVNNANMHEYTHVILDEVHEREQDSDFSLLVVRKLLRSNSKHVKVILMSATFDTHKFAEYFAVNVRGSLQAAPVVSVEGDMYKVPEYYIEDLKSLGPMPDLDSADPRISKESFELAVKLIKHFDALEIQEQGKGTTGFAKKRGTVLVFMPGLADINEMEEMLDKLTTSHFLKILPLHSTITVEEQGRVFKAPESGMRKIILSTNIAESSITVPDIKFVIDFCLTKNLVCDPDTNYSLLEVDWASKANCTQRKGRAGRVSTGRVYRMVTRRFYQENIPQYGTPEMQRCPLHHAVLKAKLLNMGEPKAILGLAMDPPNLDDIRRTILLLKEVGALASLRSGAVNPHDGDLTFVGRVLAALPVDIHVGKLLVMGHAFGLLEECLIIGAALSQKNFFARPFKDQFKAYTSLLGWANGSFSDCIAYLNAYRVWEQNKNLGTFRRANESEVAWGRRNMIQIKRIQEVQALVQELKVGLRRFNIQCPHHMPNRRRNMEEDQLILKLVICGAFYPYYFVCRSTDEKDAIRTMSGKNPFTTVRLKGLPANQGSLYKEQVEKMFTNCGKNPRAHFEETKAFIEFEREQHVVTGTPNHISPGVYLAVKMRQLRINLVLELKDAEEAHQMMIQLREQQELRTKQRLRTNRIKAVSDRVASVDMPEKCVQVDLPGPDQSVIQLYITEILDCGHFWAHYADEETWFKMSSLHEAINGHGGRNLVPFNTSRECPGPGTICLAPFLDETIEYYRARIDKVIRGSPKVKVRVFFVDYGNMDVMDVTELRQIPPELLTLPFQAFECNLCCITPCAVKCPSGQWSAEAKKFFTEMVARKWLYGEVYSVVHGVVRLDLYEQVPMPHGRPPKDVHINEVLKDRCFADPAEEGLLSQQDHARREEDQHHGIALKPMSPSKDDDWLHVPMEELTLPSSMIPKQRGRKMTKVLQGPHNPYEMQFYSLCNIGRLRAAKIEGNSVNSVALNDSPQNQHDRMMVAAYVGLNPRGNTMMARDTTLIPNFPGMPAIMALLFCPTAELRTDRHKRKYTGALCGLGWDQETHGPALPEHDIEVAFDTSFDDTDLCSINGVRMAINLAVGSEEDVTNWGADAVFKIQQSARQKLLALVKKRREVIEKVEFNRHYRWNQVDPEDVMFASIAEMDSGKELLTLHSGIMLCEEEEEEEDHETEQEILQKKRQHVEWLHTKASRSTVEEELKCELCNTMTRTPRQLMLHLATRMHKEQEVKLMQ